MLCNRILGNGRHECSAGIEKSVYFHRQGGRLMIRPPLFDEVSRVKRRKLNASTSFPTDFVRRCFSKPRITSSYYVSMS